MKKVIKKSWKYVLLIIWLVMMISFISQTAQAFSSRNYDLGGDMLIVSMLWIYVLISKLNEYELNKSIMIKNEIIDTRDTTVNELIKSRDRIMKSVKTAWEDN
ncbi:hypothetical protein EFN43_09240 [Pediococcus pentosaceus]|uniref:hypothetical protein n=1 Tax=Pediococcus pentosaceus TaxID=1255 RepID=UPI0021A83360|nr:hypothetical protein [Pediococcus pentosaceus]MCT3021242.1 hypothetical protein [Pediococcus pentosaceus]